MRVGFIGLGTMGASMALNVQAAEHEVAVNDLRRDAAAPHLKAGATWADGPREIAAHAEVIFTSLPGPREVEAVAEDLLASMKPGSAWFDLSTNSPTVIRKLHARFAAKNIALLDAPVSGGPLGAKTRKLALLVGGDKAVFDKFKPALDAIGDQVIYIGPIGAGSVAKLVHNMAGYAMQTALAEVFTHGRQGRRRAARAVGRGAAMLARPPAHVRPPRQAIPARRIRSAGFRAEARVSRTSRSRPNSRATSACRCASRNSRAPK